MSHFTRSVAILAGGQATRFGGRDKERPAGGRPRHPRSPDRGPRAADRRSDGCWGIERSRLVRRCCAPFPTPCRCGPLGGLHAALTAARSDVVLLVACDMPYLSAPFAEYLLSLAGDADVVVPQSERGYHPLCAVYTRACLGPAAAQLADRRLKMRELVDRMRTRVVPVEDIRRFGDPTRLLANVNTPADYADLEALQGHKP